MGARLAQAAVSRGYRVAVVSGPIHEPLPAQARVIRVERTEEMGRALRRETVRADVVIMAAAVADFRPARPSATKLTRRGRLRLELTATPDLIAQLPRRSGQLVVGFALETDSVLQRARRKLTEKRLDLVVAQQAARTARGGIGGSDSPFGDRPVRAWLLSRDGSVRSLGRRSKAAIAGALLDKIEALWYGQHTSSLRRQ